MEAALHADSLLAAGLHQPLSENSHQGHQLSSVVLYPRIGFVNSNTATGMRVCLYDAGRGSRCTGKERDQESGLDYFGARYYGSALGRFTSPDPKQITTQRRFDPQQWNAYAYTRNNPLQFVDPDGKELRLPPGADASKVIAVLAHAYTKADFRPLFDKLSASKNVHYVTNADIPQDPKKEAQGIVTEGTNNPKPVDPSQPISNTNLVNTISLDNTFVFGKGVTDYSQDSTVGHEFTHGVKIDSDPQGELDKHNNPAQQKVQEDEANKQGAKVAGEDSSMDIDKARQNVMKALNCSSDGSGKVTCK